ncbi:MAG: hypothetical protein V2B18_11285 [Pseudomonadota bacterium]
MRYTLPVIIMALVVGGHVLSRAAQPLEKKGRAAVYEVPTSGTILDVTYRPEFDEWWIKCREGDAIAVYSLDQRTNKWGKVHFVTKPAGKQPEKPEKVPSKPKPQPEAHPEKPPSSDAVDVEKPKEPQSITVKQIVPEGTKEEPPKKEAPEEKSNWWNPANILKEGKKIFTPGDHEKDKAPGQAPYEPQKP